MPSGGSSDGASVTAALTSTATDPISAITPISRHGILAGPEGVSTLPATRAPGEGGNDASGSATEYDPPAALDPPGEALGPASSRS